MTRLIKIENWRALVRMGMVVSRPGPGEAVYSLSVAGESRGAA